ncbi:hypothetical protein FACS1894199_06690 [Bacteroidia bacterium]|nr:hypothetical protein FACS1894199_06690 [Bacteroidia bacterium]
MGVAIFSTAALLSACAREVDCGVCGANPTYCSWSYSSNKELTIKGTGEMIKKQGDILKGVSRAHYEWYKYLKEMVAVDISGVTVIGDEAFEGCTSLTSVNVGSDVVTIGKEAFNGCTGITKLSLPSSVIEIGSYAFNKCTGITELNIPKRVTTIGESAFNRCTGLTKITIPNSVTEIGSNAFGGCTGVTEINIGSGLTVDKIGGSFALGGLTNLTAINVDAKNVRYCSVDGVLFDKDTTVLLEYPIGKQGAYIVPNTVTMIGKYAFNGAAGLTDITIPSSVVTIEEGAFKSCTGLTFAVVPEGVTTIGSYIFQECTGLTWVTIPKSLTKSGGSVFYGCTNLKERPKLPQSRSRSNTQRNQGGWYGW